LGNYICPYLRGPIVLLGLFILGCEWTSYNRSEIVGSYELVYDAKRVEFLTLNDNGTFVQTFDAATHSGTWEYFHEHGRNHVLLKQQQIFVRRWATAPGLVYGDLTVERGDHGPELMLDPNNGWTYVRVDNQQTSSGLRP
jgi:hypothetical protein